MPFPIQSDLDALKQIVEAHESRRLMEVYEVVDADCREKLYLQFRTQTLVFEANPDLDTLGVQCEDADVISFPALARVSHTAPWQDMVGRELCWGWATLNHQGYCDGAMLSFADCTPSLVLNVTGSSIQVYQVRPVAALPAEVASTTNGVLLSASIRND